MIFNLELVDAPGMQNSYDYNLKGDMPGIQNETTHQYRERVA